MVSYSKKEIALKLGLAAQQSGRINYQSLKHTFQQSGLLVELNITEQQYDRWRRRFNSIQSAAIESRLFQKEA